MWWTSKTAASASSSSRSYADGTKTFPKLLRPFQQHPIANCFFSVWVAIINLLLILPANNLSSLPVVSATEIDSGIGLGKTTAGDIVPIVLGKPPRQKYVRGFDWLFALPALNPGLLKHADDDDDDVEQDRIPLEYDRNANRFFLLDPSTQVFKLSDSPNETTRNGKDYWIQPYHPLINDSLQICSYSLTNEEQRLFRKLPRKPITGTEKSRKPSSYLYYRVNRSRRRMDKLAFTCKLDTVQQCCGLDCCDNRKGSNSTALIAVLITLIILLICLISLVVCCVVARKSNSFRTLSHRLRNRTLTTSSTARGRKQETSYTGLPAHPYSPKLFIHGKSTTADDTLSLHDSEG